MAYCPIVLTGHLPAVVIGGGEVAERKVQGLLQADAAVRVVSPQLTPTLAQFAREGRIQVTARGYLPGDLAGARLVVAATDQPEVNAAIADDSAARGCLVNVVDDPQRCTFHMPAVIRRSGITIGISTGAASPALARHLRETLDAVLGPEYEPLVAILADLRTRLRDREPVERGAARPWGQLIETLLPLLRAGEVQTARQVAEHFAAESAQEGER